MKNRHFLLLLAFMAVLLGRQHAVSAECETECGGDGKDTCSHTFFRPRPLSQNSVLALALHNYQRYHNDYCYEESDRASSFVIGQATAPFYFYSTNTKSLAKYFLPECKESITIAQNNTSDISSPWLDLISTGAPFSSEVEIRPRRTLVGGAFSLWVDFGAWTDNWTSNAWLSVFVPVVRAKHDVNFEELNSTNNGAVTMPNPIRNAGDAFNNPEWDKGRISRESHSKTGVDDIAIKLGYNFIRTDCDHGAFYLLVFAPTGLRSDADYLFEPIFGSGHTGFGGGFNGEYLISSRNEHNLSVIGDLRYAYFFKKRETRSFDLCNCEWSRYLLVVDNTSNEARANPKPGINCFTFPVDVTPRSMVELWLALHYNRSNWNVEIGYDFWWRQREKLCLEQFDKNIGIYDIAGCCRITASQAKINAAVRGEPNAPESDLVPTSVNLSDFNSRSAAVPSTSSSTVYGAFGYDFCAGGYPGMVGLGVQYEIAHNKAALSQVGVWLKSGIGF